MMLYSLGMVYAEFGSAHRQTPLGCGRDRETYSYWKELRMQRTTIVRAPSLLALGFSVLAALVLALGLTSSAGAQSTTKPLPEKRAPMVNQVILGFPLTTTVEDTTQMDIRYRDPNENQFYGDDAEGVFLWVNVAGQTKVFGPEHVPAGNYVNPYTFVSNTKTGSGTPSNPWVVTTVVSAPGTPLRLTQRATYVNGAEFIGLNFSLQQIGGTAPITATLFHAADLYTNGNDNGYGFYDPATGGVGDYVTQTTGTLYQQFVPNSNSPATAYMENLYYVIWDAIGDTTGPGSGFNNTIIGNTLHDSGAGLQWDLTVPTTGSVAVGDTDLFSPHASLCGSFSDVPYGSFYYDYVYYLACHGIVSGYSDTTFRPNSTATRGQLAKMVVLARGWTIVTPTTPTFRDVPTSNAFYPYVETAYSHSVISGYNCGGPGEPCPGLYFRWGTNVTRGQTAKIIVNAFGWMVTPPTTPTFRDVPTTNTFYGYIETAYSHNIISGYSCGAAGEPCPGLYFRWANNVTRGQLSKILYLAINPANR